MYCNYYAVAPLDLSPYRKNSAGRGVGRGTGREEESQYDIEATGLEALLEEGPSRCCIDRTEHRNPAADISTKRIKTHQA